MPPKKQQKPSAKAEQKKKDRIVEDKTFGLKNKKGGKQQKFIKNVTHQVKFGGNPSARKQEQMKEEERRRKEDKKKTGDELDGLFKPVMQQNKVGKGADPKSVLCAFYKQGTCQKGAKCKFSHDLTIERKSEKRSLYVDNRDEEDSMDTWDEDKLQEVVEKKHGAHNQNTTEKVCKHFLQAIEEKKYGWFWVCPNGGDQCMYRHALPPGFILKSEKKKMEEQTEKISIEDLVEKERAALGSNVTKITLESFLVWKKKKREEKHLEFEASKEKRKTDFKAGSNAVISGREMFEFRPELVNQEEGDDADAATITVSRCDDISENINDLSINSFTPTENSVPVINSEKGGTVDSEQLGAAAGATNGSATISNTDEVPVDEDLFTEELDDLDELDDD